MIKDYSTLSDDERILHFALDSKKVHIYVLELLPNRQLLYRYANPAFDNRPHKDLPEKLAGTFYSDTHSAAESEKYYDQLMAVVESGEAIEYESISRHGRVSIKSLTPHIDKVTGKKFVTAVTANIRELKDVQNKFAYESLHDPLTGLGNRRLLEDRIRQIKTILDKQFHEGNTGSMAGILKLDLDDFKNNNDKFGHQTGDKLLVKVAQRIRLCVREADSVIREGGDEFTVLLPNTSKNGAVTVATKIISDVSKPYEIDDKSYSLGVSIGISFYPDGEKTFEQVDKQADNALYHAKRSGKNSFKIFAVTDKAG